ncbi:nicotinamide N-methyltransferase-like [Eleutherodactylus coqui]|uniref:nicotinamide N-methyltransferase-like n=1 Tax=Eleutherodactylus coqui TaxID=57060 RepID=UPI0034634E14
MDSSCKKIYCSHELDAKNLFDTFLSAHVPYSFAKEITLNVVNSFSKAFSTGMVTGRTAIDCSAGPIFYHLLPMSDVQEITVLKLNDASLKEIKKWRNKEPDAFDWTHATETLQELKGKSDELEDEEEKLRGKIGKILKWDPSEGSPADALSLPKADIVTNIMILESISKDEDEFRCNLRKMCDVMNPRGYLLSYSPCNASYLNVGEDKFHLLPCDEKFYRKLFSEEGLEIKHLFKFDRVMRTDAIDHEGSIFIIAQKLKEP